MKVRNNLANPYMLCGVLIPAGGVAEVNDTELETMKQFDNFKKLFDSKSLEDVGVQAVSPGFDSNDSVQINKLSRSSDDTVKEPKVNDLTKFNKK